MASSVSSSFRLKMLYKTFFCLLFFSGNVMGIGIEMVPDPKTVYHTLPGIDDWLTWSPEELEKQMSPSRWSSQNKTPEEVINQYIQIGLDGTNANRAELPSNISLKYGAPLHTEAFDIYGTDLPPDSPIMLWIHGGYWQEGSKDISGHFAHVLYKNGFITCVLGYTLAPAASIEQIQDQVLQAVNKLGLLYPKSKIIVGGHSCGAQLAASLLYNEKALKYPGLSSRVAGLFLVSGVYDLRPLVPTYVNAPLNMTPENAKSLSPLFNNITGMWQSSSLKNLFIVGQYDSPEYQRQSVGYFDLIKIKFETKFWISLSDDHYTIVENLRNASSPVGQQLQTYLQQFKKVGNSNGSGNSIRACQGLLLAFQACIILFSILFMYF